VPRYFFDVEDGELTRDEDGQVFASLREVEEECMRAICEMGRDWLPDGKTRRIEIIVRDDADRPVLTMTLSVDVERAAAAAPALASP
jgi:hypothetical protein